MAKKRVRRASAEFEGAELGDERLAKIADALAASPGSSFPKVTADESELEAVYRFMTNARVSR